MADSKIFMGSGTNRFSVHHDWLKFAGCPFPHIPNCADVQGLAEDPETGELYLTFAETTAGNVSKEAAVLVFDFNGVFLRRFGTEAHKGGHGVRFFKQGKSKYIFVTCVNTQQVYKYDAKTGKLLLTVKKPRSYGAKKFKPTNVAPLSDGRFVVTDGYGSSFILLYSEEGKLLSVFDGTNYQSLGALNQPHGITAIGDDELLIADRKNLRFIRANSNGSRFETVVAPEFSFPCNIHRGLDGRYVVPELWHSVAICDSNFNIIERLGDGRGQHQHDSYLAKADTTFRQGLVDGLIPESAIDPNYFLYPHDAIWTVKHGGGAGNILVCEWNFYRRGMGVTLLRPCAE